MMDFLKENNLRRTRPLITANTELAPGYEVSVHSITINLPMDIEMPFYNIAIVRPVDSYEYFFLFVFKSTKQMHDEFDKILSSFCEIDRIGTPVNAQGAYELKIPETWNEETKAYFEKLGAKTLVTTVDGSAGIKGFVTDAMEGLDYSYFYTCGPEPMLKAIYDKSETSGQFSFEERMGCGFGACMGCSCKTKYGNKRICRDGPVLEKEEIIW